jgi:hypothetical protein
MLAILAVKAGPGTVRARGRLSAVEHRPRSRQAGLVGVVVLVMLVMGSLGYLVTFMNRSSAELSNETERRNDAVLRQAKAALISYAVSRALGTDGEKDQPGSLPCPDTNDNGIAEDEETPGYLCDQAAERVGRLPWKTLGIEDLRDTSGERLWYALSANFSANNNTAAINSNTAGQFTITAPSATAAAGPQLAAGVAAVVIAARAAVAGQTRGSSDSLNPVNYLDGPNAGVTGTYVTTNATTNVPTDPAQPTLYALNDRVMALSPAEIFDQVEGAIALRIARDIKPYLNTYNATWGRYPFAAQFGNPNTSQYKGVDEKLAGFLPVTRDPEHVTWRNLNNPIVQIGGTGSITDISAPTCDIVDTPTSTIQCDVLYVGQPRIRISGRANRVGMSVVRRHVLEDITATNWVSGNPVALTNFSTSNSMDSDGIGTVRLEMELASPVFFVGVVRIMVPVPPYSDLSSTVGPAAWFAANQWQRLTYYTLAQALAPDGTGTCAASPSAANPCLTVKTLPAPTGTSANRQVVLILMGRALTGQTRPSSNPVNYLELDNYTSTTSNSAPIPYIFGNREGFSSSINDKVVVIAP